MIVLGRITAPFGVHGWLKVHPFGDDPAAWISMPQWWLGANDETGAWQASKLKGCKLHGDGLIVLFEGLDSRTAAETMIGLYVAAPRADLPKVARDEYYWSDLIGLDVLNLADEPLGQVEKLLSTGAHEVLCLRDGETERLLPFVATVVKDVDLGKRCIRVDWARDW